MAQSTSEYLREIQQAVELVNPDDIDAIIARLLRAFREERTIFTCGNGASAALASHMACDLGKGTAVDLGRGPESAAARRLRVLSLNDNMALLTAYSNDLAYADVFMEQLKNLLSPDDVVIGISGSGGSPNVLNALTYARRIGATTVGLTGSQPSAWQLLELSDLHVQVASQVMEQIEDLHVMVHHAIGLGLRARIAAEALVASSAQFPAQPQAAYVHPGD